MSSLYFDKLMFTTKPTLVSEIIGCTSSEKSFTTQFSTSIEMLMFYRNANKTKKNEILLFHCQLLIFYKYVEDLIIVNIDLKALLEHGMYVVVQYEEVASVGLNMG